MYRLSYPVLLTGACRFRIGWFGRPVLQVEETTKCIESLRGSAPLVDGFMWRDAHADDLLHAKVAAALAMLSVT